MTMQVNYTIPSETSDEVYTVDIERGTCTCPYWKFRCAKHKTDCKHLTTARKMVESQVNKELQDVQVYDGQDAIEFIEQYGEQKLNMLKQIGSVIEFKGKLKVIQ